MLDHTALQLDREGIKEREDGERGSEAGGGGKTIIRGRRLFYIFPSKGGDYSGEAIILNISFKGGRLFKGGDYFKYFLQRGAIIRGRRLNKDAYYSRNTVNTSTVSPKNWNAI